MGKPAGKYHDKKKFEEIYKIDAEISRYSGLKSNQTNWFFPDSAHSHAQAFICLFLKGKASL